MGVGHLGAQPVSGAAATLFGAGVDAQHVGSAPQRSSRSARPRRSRRSRICLAGPGVEQTEHRRAQVGDKAGDGVATGSQGLAGDDPRSWRAASGVTGDAADCRPPERTSFFSRSTRLIEPWVCWKWSPATIESSSPPTPISM